MTLIKKYFIVAARNLLKHKLYTTINVVGLAIGISCFAILTLIIRKELAYDVTHPHYERVFRVASSVENASNTEKLARVPYLFAPRIQQLEKNVIEKIVRVFDYQLPIIPIIYNNRQYNEKGFVFADSTFFDFFDVKFKEGNPQTALSDSFSVVISEELAKKYFANESALGKEIFYQTAVKLKVTGVLKKEQAPSHLKADLICSFSTLYNYPVMGRLSNWNYNSVYTYIRFSDKLSKQEIYEKKLNALIQKDTVLNKMKHNQLFLQAITDIHLYSHLQGEIEKNGYIRYAFILGAIALLIALIAVINYTNLSTARYTLRAREVAVRKMLGADNREIIFQFMIESLLITLISVMLALVFFEIILSSLADTLTGFMAIPNQNEIALPVFSIGLVLGLSAGIYPALQMSSFSPLDSMRVRMVRKTQGNVLRKCLVVVQFVIASFLLSITLVNLSQIIFMRSSQLGFNKENILIIPISHTTLIAKYDYVKDELLKIDGVASITVMENMIGIDHLSRSYQLEGTPKANLYHSMMVRPDFIETFQIKLIAGRSFESDTPLLQSTDTTNFTSNNADDSISVIVNREMVTHLGFSEPNELIGKKFTSPRGEEKIIGVVENFHVQSLHEPLLPFVIDMSHQLREKYLTSRYMALRFEKEGDKEQIIKGIKKIWQRYLPLVPFEFFYLEDELDRIYFQEERLAKISAYFTEVAILIACMGLFGLSSFFATSKRHEIGIRKALGASFWEITWLLTKFFAPLVFISIFVGNLLAYLVSNYWLQSFAFHISQSIAPYFLSSISVILLSFFIVGFHAIRAAWTNPVNDLRN